MVGLFALWHGHAHGAEMPALAAGIEYALGFVLATLLLHVIGIAFGLGMQRLAHERAVHLTGASIALCGVYLAVAYPRDHLAVILPTTFLRAFPVVAERPEWGSTL